MSITSIPSAAQNLPQTQTHRAASAPQVSQTSAPVEQRASSSAPQAVGQAQASAKNVSATQNNKAQNSQSAQAAQGNELQQLQEAAQKISSHLNIKNNSLEFSVDQASGKNVVKIIDKTTKEVVRQIPSEEALHIAEALDELDEIRQGLILSTQG